MTTTDLDTASVPPRRRHVVVNGVRVRTVDVHAHCAVPEAVHLFEETVGTKIAVPETLLLSSAERLQTMDERGIDVEALSINPFWYGASREVAEELITTQNERLAEFCASEPERFVAFASVALQYPDLAAAQLYDGVRRYGLRGVAIGGSVDGRELADADFHPFWAAAVELEA